MVVLQHFVYALQWHVVNSTYHCLIRRLLNFLPFWSFIKTITHFSFSSWSPEKFVKVTQQRGNLGNISLGL